MKIPASVINTGSFKTETQQKAYKAAVDIRRECLEVADTMERFDGTSADLRSAVPTQVWIDRESVAGGGTLSGSAKFGQGLEVDSLSANVETAQGKFDSYSIGHGEKGSRFQSPLGVATFDAKGNIVVDVNPPSVNEAGSFTQLPRRWD